MNSEKYKQRSIEQWTKNPISSYITKHKEGTIEFFEEIADFRYRVECSWFKPTFKFEQYKDKKVLEIGVGDGIDHLELAKAGAILTGIDITPKSIELTKKNLELHGYKSNLLIADAENLPFEDDSFDVIYSFGVLHHVPNTQKAIDEIYRVLKPKGKAVISLYHKNSLFLISVIIFEMILKGGFLRKTIQERLSEIEYNGGETKPLVKVYTRQQIKRMFNQFNKLRVYARHSDTVFTRSKIDKIIIQPFLGRLLKLLSKRWGWYLIIEAKK